MATELETLVVTLEASVKQYERQLAKAQGTTVSAMRNIQRTIAQSETRVSSQMEKVGVSMAKSLSIGFGRTLKLALGSVVTGAVLRNAIDGIRKIGDIGDVADDLGLTTQALQTFRKEMELTGGSADDMDKALQSIVTQLADSESIVSKFLDANKIDRTGKSTTELVQIFFRLVGQIKDADKALAFMTDVTGKKIAAKVMEPIREGFDNAAAASGHFTDEQIRQADEMIRAWDEFVTKFEMQLGAAILKATQDWQQFGQIGDRAIDTISLAVTRLLDGLQHLDAWAKKSGFSDWLSKHVLDTSDPLKDLEDPATRIARVARINAEREQSEREYQLGITKKGLQEKIDNATITGIGKSYLPGWKDDLQRVNAELEQVQSNLIKIRAEMAKQGDVSAAVPRIANPRGGGAWHTSGDFFLARGASPYGVLQSSPALRDAAQRLIDAAERQLGENIRISSMARTHKQQIDAYHRYQTGQGGLAAVPGTSRHEVGEAIDVLASQKALAWLHANAAQFGLRPLAGHAGEIDPGHFQLVGGTPIIPAKTAVTAKTAKTAEVIKHVTAADIEYAKTERAIEGLTEAYNKNQQAAEASAQAMQQSAQEVAGAFESAFTGFVDAIIDGQNATEALHNALKSLAKDLLHMAIHNIFAALFPQPGQAAGAGAGGGIGSLFGFQHGGQFRVGGAGGTDSSLVAFRATPGEEVTVTPRRLAGTRGSGGISMGGTIINIEGSADERTVEMMDRRIAANNHRQRKALERDWGSMSARYQQLRG